MIANYAIAMIIAKLSVLMLYMLYNQHHPQALAVFVVELGFFLWLRARLKRRQREILDILRKFE